jgi:YHS domain-containing protein
VIRAILYIILVLVLYQALKAVIRSAVSAYHGDSRPLRPGGSDMVLDPNCRTYVVKDRAVTRRLRGETAYFCSASCAEEFEKKSRQLP